MNPYQAKKDNAYHSPFQDFFDAISGEDKKDILICSPYIDYDAVNQLAKWKDAHRIFVLTQPSETDVGNGGHSPDLFEALKKAVEPNGGLRTLRSCKVGIHPKESYNIVHAKIYIVMEQGSFMDFVKTKHKDLMHCHEIKKICFASFGSANFTKAGTAALGSREHVPRNWELMAKAEDEEAKGQLLFFFRQLWVFAEYH